MNDTLVGVTLHNDIVRLVDHYRLRSVFEAEIARFAAERRTENDLGQLKRALIARGPFDSSLDIDLFIERDMYFHACITKASHNEVIKDIYKKLSPSIKKKQKKYYQ